MVHVRKVADQDALWLQFDGDTRGIAPRWPGETKLAVTGSLPSGPTQRRYQALALADTIPTMRAVVGLVGESGGGCRMASRRRGRFRSRRPVADQIGNARGAIADPSPASRNSWRRCVPRARLEVVGEQRDAGLGGEIAVRLVDDDDGIDPGQRPVRWRAAPSSRR